MRVAEMHKREDRGRAARRDRSSAAVRRVGRMKVNAHQLLLGFKNANHQSLRNVFEMTYSCLFLNNS